MFKLQIFTNLTITKSDTRVIQNDALRRKHSNIKYQVFVWTKSVKSRIISSSRLIVKIINVYQSGFKFPFRFVFISRNKSGTLQQLLLDIVNRMPTKIVCQKPDTYCKHFMKNMHNSQISEKWSLICWVGFTKVD